MLVVRTDAGRFEFPASDPLTFPAAPDPPAGAVSVTVPGADFRSAVARTAVAADRRASPTTWATTGVLFEVRGGFLRLTATDTHRLASADVPLVSDSPADPVPEGRALLPARAARAWADAARGCDHVALTLWGNGAAVVAGPLSAWSPLCSGAFPAAAVEGLFEAARPHRLTTDPAALLAAVELALVAADPDERGVCLHVAPGRVTASAESEDLGSARVDVPAEGYAGPPVQIPLDGRRLGEFLAALAGVDLVTLAWDANDRPVVLTCPGCRYLQVPLVDRRELGRPELRAWNQDQVEAIA